MRDDLRKDLWIVLTAAVLGSLFGAIHNSFDVRISPEFYRVIKHAPASVSPQLWAAYIGMTRGFVLGLLFGAGFCFASDSGSAPPMIYRQLVVWMVIPILFSAMCSAVYAALPLRSKTEGVLNLSPPTRRSLEVVQRMHTGVYVGGFLGTALAIRGIRRKRASMQS